MKRVGNDGAMTLRLTRVYPDGTFNSCELRGNSGKDKQTTTKYSHELMRVMCLN